MADATSADCKKMIAAKLFAKEPDACDDMYEVDLKGQAEAFFKYNPFGKLEVHDRRAWHKFAHHMKKERKEHERVTCSFCTHETDSRDFFCEVCYGPMKVEDEMLKGKKREAADNLLHPKREPLQ